MCICNTHSVCTLCRIWVCKPLKYYFFVNLSILMVFLGTSSCAPRYKKTFFQVLYFYLLVRTQNVCSMNRLMRTIQKSSLWWSFLLLQRIYEDFFVGTWKCPHNLNRPHFAGVYTYECPHRCAKVHAHTHNQNMWSSHHEEENPHFFNSSEFMCFSSSLLFRRM